MLALADASRSSKKQLLLCRKESCLVMVLSLLLHLVRYELDDRLPVGSWWQREGRVNLLHDYLEAISLVGRKLMAD